MPPCHHMRIANATIANGTTDQGARGSRRDRHALNQSHFSKRVQENLEIDWSILGNCLAPNVGSPNAHWTYFGFGSS